MSLFVLDRLPLGVLELTGMDRASFLQGMVSNDVAALTPGTSCHAALLDTTGHILANLHIHARPDALLVETDPATLSVLRVTLDKFLIMEDVQIADVSDHWAVVSVLSSEASDLPADLQPSAYPTSFPILPGLDLWLPAGGKDAAKQVLFAAGFIPMTDGDADALRIEAGIPKWGSELSPSVLLPEAEMTDAVSYTKGCYVGQEIVARLHARGHTNKALRRILLAEDAPVPPVGATLHVPEDGPEPGREIGSITSAAESPSRGGQSIALGYVRKEYFAPGTAISVQIAQPNGLVFSYPAEVL